MTPWRSAHCDCHVSTAARHRLPNHQIKINRYICVVKFVVLILCSPTAPAPCSFHILITVGLFGFRPQTDALLNCEYLKKVPVEASAYPCFCGIMPMSWPFPWNSNNPLASLVVENRSVPCLTPLITLMLPPHFSVSNRISELILKFAVKIYRHVVSCRERISAIRCSLLSGEGFGAVIASAFVCADALDWDAIAGGMTLAEVAGGNRVWIGCLFPNLNHQHKGLRITTATANQIIGTSDWHGHFEVGMPRTLTIRSSSLCIIELSPRNSALCQKCSA